MRVLDMLAPPQRSAALADTHHERLPRVRLSAPRSDVEVSAGSLSLSADEVAQLNGRGFLVRDNVFGLDTVRALRAEAELQRASGSLHAAGLSRGADFYTDASVRSDEILWLSSLAASDAPHVDSALSSAVRRLDSLRVWLDAACGFGSLRCEVQLACYAGGGARYVRHLDAFVGGTERRLTALYYLNERWTHVHGGQLRLYDVDADDIADNDTIRYDAANRHVDIAPVADRLLVFQSRVLEHEVLPAHSTRFSLTVWFH